MIFPRFIFLLIPLMFCLGCAYGYSVRFETTMINDAYSPSDEVDVYFASYSGEKKYEEIALIRTLGIEGLPMSQLIEYLKNEAQSLGANAVINIERSNAERVEGIFLLDLIAIFSGGGVESSRDTFIAPVLTGIAIRYVE